MSARYTKGYEEMTQYEDMTPEQKLLDVLFGEKSDSDKMQNAISELNNAIILLHNPRITKSIAMDAVRSIQIAKQIIWALQESK
jgi:hypothetical protein